MMKTLYLECGMGAAGDMLTAALLELLPDQDIFLKKINDIAPDCVKVTAEKTVKCGISGTHMHVTIHGEEEGHEAHHEHRHHHASMADVVSIIKKMQLPESVENDSMNVYKLIADAESHAHGMPVSEIHFHEVGTLDAIMDVVSVCSLIHELSPEQIIASPVRTGFGHVHAAHGIMPVPAPATAFLLEGIPTYAGDIEGEMCTPTGAALLKYFVKKFEERPVMTVKKTGYGMGSKDFSAANCLRAFLGETAEDSSTDQIIELRCNLDDMTGEQIGFATTKLFEAGARDVFTTAISMKKNRPGILLTVLCKESERTQIVTALFKHTTTIGIRETVCSRYILNRHEVTENGIRRKVSEGYGVRKVKSEFDDIAVLADKEDKSVFEIQASTDTNS